MTDVLPRVFHAHFVLFEKKETKTDGNTAREPAQISSKYSPKVSSGGTIFVSILATDIPK
ncbi:MAG: hypothetical protein CSA33_04775 [Desulfobulbus propionicus]|nr:MAG: hypothetical protein CSA33_04775 [Desulfobulbus propionicus]